jgi:hypothetical protein
MSYMFNTKAKTKTFYAIKMFPIAVQFMQWTGQTLQTKCDNVTVIM